MPSQTPVWHEINQKGAFFTARGRERKKRERKEELSFHIAS